MIDQRENFQLVDVRELCEYELNNIGGELIPLGELKDNIDRIAKDKPVVVICQGGVRSAKAIQTLERAAAFEQLYNLRGGILAYGKEVDDSVTLY